MGTLATCAGRAAAPERGRPIDTAPDPSELHDVTRSVIVEVAGCSGPGRISTLYLGWRRTEPLAVDLRLSTVPGHPALPRGEWSMLRDFLRYGLTEPTGDGAVRLRPTVEGAISLVLGHRHYAVTAPSEDLEAFLDETERHVPAGADSESADLDALVQRLLNGQ